MPSSPTQSQDSTAYRTLKVDLIQAAKSSSAVTQETTEKTFNILEGTFPEDISQKQKTKLQREARNVIRQKSGELGHFLNGEVEGIKKTINHDNKNYLNGAFDITQLVKGKTTDFLNGLEAGMGVNAPLKDKNQQLKTMEDRLEALRNKKYQPNLQQTAEIKASHTKHALKEPASSLLTPAYMIKPSIDNASVTMETTTKEAIRYGRSASKNIGKMSTALEHRMQSAYRKTAAPVVKTGKKISRFGQNVKQALNEVKNERKQSLPIPPIGDPEAAKDASYATVGAVALTAVAGLAVGTIGLKATTATMGGAAAAGLLLGIGAGVSAAHSREKYDAKNENREYKPSRTVALSLLNAKDVIKGGKNTTRIPRQTGRPKNLTPHGGAAAGVARSLVSIGTMSIIPTMQFISERDHYNNKRAELKARKTPPAQETNASSYQVIDALNNNEKKRKGKEVIDYSASSSMTVPNVKNQDEASTSQSSVPERASPSSEIKEIRSDAAAQDNGRKRDSRSNPPVQQTSIHDDGKKDPIFTSSRDAHQTSVRERRKNTGYDGAIISLGRKLKSLGKKGESFTKKLQSSAKQHAR